MGNWILDGKRFHETTKRWYCHWCDKRTQIELNAQWVADGKPLRWEHPVDYQWFSRCACCQHETHSASYGCPNCGCTTDDDEPLKIENHRLNSYYSYEFGVTGYDWEELHQCRKCRTKYWISNSSC